MENIFYNNKTYKFKNNYLNENKEVDVTSYYNNLFNNNPDEVARRLNLLFDTNISAKDIKNINNADSSTNTENDAENGIDTKNISTISSEELNKQIQITKDIDSGIETFKFEDIPSINN